MPVEGRSHRPGTRRPPNPTTSSPPRSIIPTRSSRRFVITWRDGLFLGYRDPHPPRGMPLSLGDTSHVSKTGDIGRPFGDKLRRCRTELERRFRSGNPCRRGPHASHDRTCRWRWGPGVRNIPNTGRYRRHDRRRRTRTRGRAHDRAGTVVIATAGQNPNR